MQISKFQEEFEADINDINNNNKKELIPNKSNSINNENKNKPNSLDLIVQNNKISNNNDILINENFLYYDDRPFVCDENSKKNK